MLLVLVQLRLCCPSEPEPKNEMISTQNVIIRIGMGNFVSILNSNPKPEDSDSNLFSQITQNRDRIG